MHTFRHRLLKLILFLAVLTAAGAIYRTIGLAIDKHLHRPPGALVDSEGYSVLL
jgi:hypothetical protein